METTTEGRARSRGLIRRFFGQGTPEEPAPRSIEGPQPRPPEIIDIRQARQPDRQTTDLRLERLEEGLRLIVETMKRTYAELSSSVESLSAQLDVADARGMVERIVSEEVGPLASSVRELAETVHRFPHTLAAAMDDLGIRIDTGRWMLERSLNEGLEDLRQLAAVRITEANGETPATPLAPRPFELEPVEEQFPEPGGDA
jgi:hypothetical protein